MDTDVKRHGGFSHFYPTRIQGVHKSNDLIVKQRLDLAEWIIVVKISCLN